MPELQGLLRSPLELLLETGLPVLWEAFGALFELLPETELLVLAWGVEEYFFFAPCVLDRLLLLASFINHTLCLRSDILLRTFSWTASTFVRVSIGSICVTLSVIRVTVILYLNNFVLGFIAVVSHVDLVESYTCQD